MALEYTYQLIFAGAVLALLAVFASTLSRRIGAPLLLVFLVLGMLAGEEGPGGIKFNDFNLAFVFGSLALAIIIFDGGLSTRSDTFRVCLKPAISLASFGVLITAGLTGLAVHWLLGLTWQEGMLIGAIIGSTDAAAVFGLLRNAGVELKERTSATLEIESGSNDPTAIFLTIALVEILQSTNGEVNPGLSLLKELLQQGGLGILMGFAGGHALRWLLRRIRIQTSLYPLLVLAGGLSIFGATSLINGSGFLAIYIAGVLIGNASLPYSKDIRRFHDGMAWLCQIGMFLMLGLLVSPSQLIPIILPAVAIAFVLIFITRPIAVWVSLLPFHFPWREQVFIGWCGLRGAVPIILALIPSLAGLENTAIYYELVFFVVLISLVLQGWTIAPVARWLKLEVPPSPLDSAHMRLMIQQEHDKELLVYHAVAGSSAIGMAVKDLPLSSGNQFVGIIRRGILLDGADEHCLLPEDKVLIIAETGTTSALGRIFTPAAAAAAAPRLEPSLFFGAFSLNPDAKLADLGQLYGFAVDEKYADATVGDYFLNQFHGKPVVGDMVRMGPVSFIVKKIEGDHIASVGLKLSQPQ